MRAPDACVDIPSSCPSYTQPLLSHNHTNNYTPTLASRLRPLLDRLSPLRSRLPSCPRIRVLLPYKYSSRWLVVLVAASLFMMVLLSYASPSHLGPVGWLAALSLGRGSDRKACRLVCDIVPQGDTSWQPQALPMEHACLSTAYIPVPCPPNYTWSEVLRMPPITFLPNYKNPCWYEDMPTGKGGRPVNPYSRNLFSCFSHGVFKMLHEMAEQYLIERETEQRAKRLRCLPYFYLAGMPKCGSTDLFRKVMQHPDVVRPPLKEPHWWSKNRFGQRLNYSSAISVHDYIDLFDNAALHIEKHTQQDNDVIPVDDDVMSVQGMSASDSPYHPVITGDASASTFWNNDEWWRLAENCGRTEPLFTNAHYIRRLTPHARVIIILRNPTERLFSDYLYFTKSNKSVESFHTDVTLSLEKLNACLARQTLRACIYDKQVANGKAKVRLRVGVYHVYLNEWLKLFPRDQLLVLRTEDYSNNLSHTMRRVYQFLGLRPLTDREEKKLASLPRANTRKQQDKNLGAMWDLTRQVLQDFYRTHNQQLAQALNDQRFLWDDVTVATQSVTPVSQSGDVVSLQEVGRVADLSNVGGDGVVKIQSDNRTNINNERHVMMSEVSAGDVSVENDDVERNSVTESPADDVRPTTSAQDDEDEDFEDEDYDDNEYSYSDDLYDDEEQDVDVDEANE